MAFNKKKDPKKKDEDIRISQSGDVQEIRKIINDHCKSNVAVEVKDKPVTVMPTGILSMDLAIGNSGLIAGRILDIYGWEGTGKTLLCLAIAANIQRSTKVDANGKLVRRIAAMLDAEGTFTKEFAASAGIDTDNLILVQSTPEKILSGENYFDIMVLLIGRGVDYMIVDSCPALTPTSVITNDMGYGQKAQLSQLMAMGLGKISPLVNANGQTLVHFINQKRGRPMAGMYEKSEQETGGNALKFFSTYRFEVVKATPILKKVLGVDGQFREKIVGVTSCVRIIKNKTCPIPPYIPSTTYHFEFDLYFEPFKDDTGMEFHRGLDVVKDYVSTGLRTGVIKQASSWFSFGSVKGNGMTELVQRIKEKPEVMSEIRDEVFQKVGSKQPVNP